MTVHFIGAGPGAPDLLTLRGRDLIAASPVCLYAGSLVPEAILAHCPDGARIVNTAPMDLDAIIVEIQRAYEAGQDVARLHSGDLSVWSAMGEQMRRIKALGIPVTVTPGVPSFAAAAAALEVELTAPGLAQSLVLTRTPGRASSMPARETLANFAATGATLAIHLSIQNLDQVVADLTPFYGGDCPVAVVYRASWPDQRIVQSRLSEIAGQVDGIARTALILVGPALAGDGGVESALYAADYDRRYRPQSAASPWAGWTDQDETETQSNEGEHG
ncbi:precorrin-4 C(11)-methyltransferase [Paracoccaceae bacterium GXU_MW_L88]